MLKQKKKNPFDPIELEGSNARWFGDYLEGKGRDKEAEKNRKKTLRRASGIKEEKPVYV